MFKSQSTCFVWQILVFFSVRVCVFLCFRGKDIVLSVWLLREKKKKPGWRGWFGDESGSRQWRSEPREPVCVTSEWRHRLFFCDWSVLSFYSPPSLKVQSSGIESAWFRSGLREVMPCLPPAISWKYYRWLWLTHSATSALYLSATPSSSISIRDYVTHHLGAQTGLNHPSKSLMHHHAYSTPSWCALWMCLHVYDRPSQWALRNSTLSVVIFIYPTVCVCSGLQLLFCVFIVVVTML